VHTTISTVVRLVVRLVGRCARRVVNTHCKQMLGNKYVMSLYVSDGLLVDGNVCRQSLGKAAAAATLYTESVCQILTDSRS